MPDFPTLALILLLGFQNGWLAANRFRRWSRPLPFRLRDDPDRKLE
jgi:hypothetical protein